MKKLFRYLVCLFIAAVAMLVCGCATTRKAPAETSATVRQASAPAVPAAPGAYSTWFTEELLVPSGDSIEGFNRSMHGFNIGLNRYVISPVSKGWRFVIPECIRHCITRFDDNLGFPLLLVTHALQGQWAECGVDSSRFFINTTVGVLGLFDPAKDKWEIYPAPGGFDNLLANWGVGEGSSLTLPVLSNGTVRSQSSKALDFAGNWVGWLVRGLGGYALIAQAAIGINNYSDIEPTVTKLTITHPYNYLLANLYNYYGREVANTRYTYDQNNPEWNPDPTLGVMALQPGSEEISNSCRHREADVDGGQVKYSCWPRKEATQLVILLPGIGTHRQDDGVLALAEMYRSSGCAVIALSSTFTPDYFEELPEGGAPAGYLPEDARQLSRTLAAVLKDYRGSYQGTAKQQCTLVGYSLGGLNALFLAAAADAQGTIAPDVQVRRFVAINPPFDPYHAVRQVDTYFDSPVAWHSGDTAAAREHVHDILLRLLAWTKPGRYNPPNRMMPLTREESLFLMGANMRLNLADCLQKQQELRNTGLFEGDPKAFAHRNDIYCQALGCSFDGYFQKVLLPWYRQHGHPEASVDTLVPDCRLDALTTRLARNPRVFVFQNQDDPLLKPEHVAWYKETLGDRATLFERGGHLGNMPSPQFQKMLLETTLKD